jgi:hypothetical protein
MLERVQANSCPAALCYWDAAQPLAHAAECDLQVGVRRELPRLASQLLVLFDPEAFSHCSAPVATRAGTTPLPVCAINLTSALSILQTNSNLHSLQRPGTQLYQSWPC